MPKSWRFDQTWVSTENLIQVQILPFRVWTNGICENIWLIKKKERAFFLPGLQILFCFGSGHVSYKIWLYIEASCSKLYLLLHIFYFHIFCITESCRVLWKCRNKVLKFNYFVSTVKKIYKGVKWCGITIPSPSVQNKCRSDLSVGEQNEQNMQLQRTDTGCAHN